MGGGAGGQCCKKQNSNWFQNRKNSSSYTVCCNRDGFIGGGGGGVPGSSVPGSPGQGGVLLFMIKLKIIRGKMRYSNLSNNMMISEL